MSIDKARRQKRKGKVSEPFFAIPTNLLKAPRFQQLSGNAVKLLCHLGSQYNGINNGRLTVVYSELESKWGWSSHTIKRAKDCLTDAGLIRQTAMGNRRTKTPDMFMLAFKYKDWSADMDNSATPPPT